jgi:hypothetical protein
VHVPAAELRNREDLLRQDQTVRDDDHEIGRVRREPLLRVGVLQLFGLLDRNVRNERTLLDRARDELSPAPGRTIGLRVDRDDVDGRRKARSRCVIEVPLR